MSNKLENKPTRVSVDQIADAAAQGVKRALQARHSADVTLTEDELAQISGGMFYTPDYFPHGIIIRDWLSNVQHPDAIEEIQTVITQ